MAEHRDYRRLSLEHEARRRRRTRVVLGDDIARSGADPHRAGPWGGQEWQANATNEDSVDQQVTAFAFCASGVGPDLVTKIRLRPGASGSALAGGVGESTASCKPGEHIMGGGGRGETRDDGHAGTVLLASAPDPGMADTWLARAYNRDTGSSHQVTAYAYCYSAGTPNHFTEIAQRGGGRTPGTADGATAHADRRPGEQLVGGGAWATQSGGGGGHVLSTSAPDLANPLRWKARSFGGGSSNKLTAYALCAR